MNSRETASLVLKLLGVYAIIEALPLFQYLGSLSLMPTMSHGEQIGLMLRAWIFFVALVPFALISIAAYLLLTRSDNIAGLLVKEPQSLIPAGSLSARDIQALVFSVVGVLVFLRGLPGVCRFAILLSYLGPGYFGNRTEDAFMRVVSDLGPLIQCVLGIVLFLQARGLANLWHRIQAARYVRIDTTKEQTPPDEVNDDPAGR
jgi:hypothetical protein